MTTGGNNPAATMQSLDGPGGLFVFGAALWVADSQHNRVLRFPLYR